MKSIFFLPCPSPCAHVTSQLWWVQEVPPSRWSRRYRLRYHVHALASRPGRDEGADWFPIMFSMTCYILFLHAVHIDSHPSFSHLAQCKSPPCRPTLFILTVQCTAKVSTQYSVLSTPCFRTLFMVLVHHGLESCTV